MLRLIEQRGLEGLVQVDSAGTSAYHVGDGADPRSIQTALGRGVELPSRARQFQVEDFDRFDYVLCMDSSNYEALLALSEGYHDEKLHLMLDFEPNGRKGRSVPDPYYGGDRGFEHVLDLCFSSCEGLLEHLVDEHNLVTEKSIIDA